MCSVLELVFKMYFIVPNFMKLFMYQAMAPPALPLFRVFLINRPFLTDRIFPNYEAQKRSSEKTQDSCLILTVNEFIQYNSQVLFSYLFSFDPKKESIKLLMSQCPALLIR